MWRATDIAKEKKKKTVVSADVFKALEELDFNKYEEQLRDFVSNYKADKEDLAQQKKIKKT